MFAVLSNIAGLLENGVIKIKGGLGLILRTFFEEIEDEKNAESLNPSTNDALPFVRPNPRIREAMTKEKPEVSMVHALNLAFGCLAIGLRCIDDKMSNQWYMFILSFCLRLSKSRRLLDFLSRTSHRTTYLHF